MSTSVSRSSDPAIGKKFLKKLLYVQHVDKQKDTFIDIPDRYLEEYLIANRTNFYDSNFTEYLKSPKANLTILKSSMGDVIMEVTVYSNPLPRLPENDVTFHAFVIFRTENHLNHKCTWWSLEKNGHHIVLQQSTNKDDVMNKIYKYDTEKKKIVKRLGPIKKEKEEMGWNARVEDLLRDIWDNNQISELYHVATSNCQHFASFICENTTGERWTTTIVERIGLKKKKIQPRIQVDAFKYKSIVNYKEFDFYRAMMEGRRKDFEQLTNNLTIECLNRVDSQGNTLLEWATVFSSSDWLIDEELKKKGAQIPSDEKLFKQNVFFIALQYLPSNKKLKLFDSFDEIDFNGVNKMGDRALHLALYGEKWEIAEKILNRFEDYDVNITNFGGDTPLLLVARLGWGFDLFKKIVNRTNSENVNKTDRNGNTALHYAIGKKSKTAVKELLNRKDVDVNIKNKDNKTALHFASRWKDIPVNMLKIIKQKSADAVHARNKNGCTALHWTTLKESETETNELIKQKSQMSSSSSSSYLSKGKKLLYVQLVDKKKNMTSEISEQILEEYSQADRSIYPGSNFTEYLKSPKSNLSILKSSLKDRIGKVTVYETRSLASSKFKNRKHAFIVFETENYSNKKTWWSLEKNTQHIVLQQSENENDAIDIIYNTKHKKRVERNEPADEIGSGWTTTQLKNLLRLIWRNNQISERYNFTTSDGQHFASFIFEKLTGKEWSTVIVDQNENQRISPLDRRRPSLNPVLPPNDQKKLVPNSVYYSL